ncbi:UbiX family flavin prenyltransferase [Granulicella sp. WH15]|uniref:UbiX family flavin prenyltransferase n=1 Tax=Granulicella sp. WH15 TaxID=2602070 RepID=UPI0021037355|nr:UbiX family flavin prenyltransferase [Granulicella sp. WH15]
MSDLKRNFTLAITGASGSVFAAEMLRLLVADERVSRVNLVVSESALRVLAEELHLSGRTALVEKLLGTSSDKVRQLADEDIGASIASGSYPTEAMIVLPCSMGTLARIAHGMASSLIERAADVTLKERRRLVLCVRETPLNLIHLRNMTAAAEAGATIYPVMPVLYTQPQDTAVMARQFVHRVLGHVGLGQADAFVWGDEE